MCRPRGSINIYYIEHVLLDFGSCVCVTTMHCCFVALRRYPYYSSSTVHQRPAQPLFCRRRNGPPGWLPTQTPQRPLLAMTPKWLSRSSKKSSSSSWPREIDTPEPHIDNDGQVIVYFVEEELALLVGS